MNDHETPFFRPIASHGSPLTIVWPGIHDVDRLVRSPGIFGLRDHRTSKIRTGRDGAFAIEALHSTTSDVPAGAGWFQPALLGLDFPAFAELSHV